MNKKELIKDAFKTLLIMALAITALLLLFGISDDSSDLRFIAGLACLGAAYILTHKWLQDDKDLKDGITQSAREEMNKA